MLRGKFNLTPRIYFYAESNLYRRRNVNYTGNADGYTAHGGIGSHLIGLFSGEIYGGFQDQWSVYHKFGSTSAPSFGFRVSIFRLPC